MRAEPAAARRLPAIALAVALAASGGAAVAHDLSFALGATEAGLSVALVYEDGGRPAEARISVRSDSADLVTDLSLPAGATVTIPWPDAAEGLVLEAVDGSDHSTWRLLTPADVEEMRATP